MICTKCGEDKHFSEFYTDGTRFGRQAYRPECKVCTLKEKKAAYWKHGGRREDPEQRAKRRIRNRKKGMVDKASPQYREVLANIHGPDGTCKCPSHVAARQKKALDKPD